MPDLHLLKVGDAAAPLSLSVDMVRVLHRRGKLLAIRTPGGYRLFLRADVERLERGQGKGAPVHSPFAVPILLVHDTPGALRALDGLLSSPD